MDKKHNNQNINHKAEEWMTIARKFGEECLAIQKNSALSIDQKLEQQQALGNKMTKKIEASSDLTAEDKQKMIDSVNHYVNKWQTVHDLNPKIENAQTPS